MQVLVLKMLKPQKSCKVQAYFSPLESPDLQAPRGSGGLSVLTNSWRFEINVKGTLKIEIPNTPLVQELLWINLQLKGGSHATESSS